MSIDALWMVRFTTLDGAPFDYGGGVAVFDGGRVFGGDSGAFYVGRYILKGDQVDIQIKVGFHDPAVPSIFGEGFSEYTLLGRGRISSDEDTIDLEATPDIAPQRGLSAKLFRLAELPSF